MNKKELVKEISALAGLTQIEASKVLDVLTTTIAEHVKKGEPVSLLGFGSFSVGKRAERMGRDPRTGATIKIKSTNNVKFKAGKKLRDAVSSGTTDNGPKVGQP